MSAIEQRVKRVLASRVEGFLLEKLAGEETDDLREARKREKQAKMKALARAAASDDGPGGGSSAVTPRGIEDMMEDEDCPVCTQILKAVADMPEPRRTKGVAEYGEFRRAIDQSEEAAIEVVESSEVLPDAMSNLREVDL